MPSFDNAQDTQSHIRNFCVIAHIDHGKSTLCDRLLELTGTVAKRDMRSQILDSNPIERERGITIKLAPVRMIYMSGIMNHESGIMVRKDPIIHNSKFILHEEYILNLIDTPGHVDFSYEVSRSLAACEGAILVVDATQGVQAQTIANLTQARKHGLTIIPVINKIDLPNARIEETSRELVSLGFPSHLTSPNLSYPSPNLSFASSPLEHPLLISAKTGEGVGELLDAIVTRIPPPKGVPTGTPRALVFSSHYDSHKGVVVFVRVVDGAIVRDSGNLKPDSRNQAIKMYQKLTFLASGAEFMPIEAGYFTPSMSSRPGLEAGEVGYIATGLKDIHMAKVGDTITAMPNAKYQMPNEKQQFSIQHSAFSITPLPGYQEPKPMVFLGLYPIDSSDITLSREAMERLRLSDSAFTFRPISSTALGNGFHCGFLGLLHAEIVQERLSREFDLNMIATAPSVEYLIKGKRQTEKGKSFEDGYLHIQSATEFPDPSEIEEVKEPIMQVKIFTPKKYIGAVMRLSQEKRGEYIDLQYVAEQAEFTYLMPLGDMIIDFFDRLKSVSEGYASLDYEFYEFQAVDVVKIDILVNHEKVDALGFLAVRDQAHHRSIAIVDRLAEVIPRQQFTIPIQGAIGGTIVARADVKSFRKDVTAKLYGGDRTRKDKLLKKQKKGKAKMKMIGNVEIPQTAFFEVLKRG